MTRLVLIDDQAIVRLGICRILETREDLTVVAEAGSRNEALRLLSSRSASSTPCPDVAVVDLFLGRDDGLEFLKELKSLCPDMQILVVSMQPENVYAERVLRAGARGYLRKKDAPEHLLEAVDTVHRGECYLIRADAARPDPHPPRNASGPSDGLGTLSDRELYVFQMVGTGYANKAIAEHLNLSPKTIETYKENLKAKLGLANARELKETATRWVEQSDFR